MSHLLCLHSFAVERFTNVFGGGSQTVLDQLLAALPAPYATPAARAAVTHAVRRGLDGSKTITAAQQAVDWAVLHALTTKKFGIGRTPISPMGASGAIFDALEAAFEEAGAGELFGVLQRGRNYEETYVLLSPDDVKLAARQLKKVAEDDDDGYLTSELLEPLTKAASKGLAVFGEWG